MQVFNCIDFAYGAKGLSISMSNGYLFAPTALFGPVCIVVAIHLNIFNEDTAVKRISNQFG